MRWLHFILSHSLFISLCAIALCFQTYRLLHLPPNGMLYAFILFSTLSSYNFYWLISKYSFRKTNSLALFIKENTSYLVVFSIAALGMLYCLFQLPFLLPYVSIAIALTLLYSLPLWPFPFAKLARKAGFLKTTLLAFTWTYVTIIIPAAELLEKDPQPVLVLFTARFFFMLLLCSIFDMRDRSVDQFRSLHSLATDVSRSTMRMIMTIAFTLYLGAGFLVRIHFKDNAQVIAFAVMGAIVWIVYRLSLKKQGYFFYYFLVDGLMLVSAFGTWLAGLYK